MQRVVSGATWTSDRTIDADAVVVGTGAGGSMMLRELARAGLRVIGLEEGPHFTTKDFVQREEIMFAALYRDGGGFATDDLAIRILAGRGTGGSTVHNTNLCKRTPDRILELWRDRHHVEGADPAAMLPYFERVERDLSVAPIPDDAINRNNDILRRGMEALGWRGGKLSHNRVFSPDNVARGCRQSGFCELGCAYDGKQNALKILLPQALERGAHVYADARATRVLHKSDRATGVEAVIDGRFMGTFRAPIVVLAGSAIGSAALARSSRLPDPHAQLGRGLHLHPGAVAAGLFDEVVDGQNGLPQSYECTEHLDFEEGAEKRTWIVPAFAHPVGAASMLPGYGAEHMKMLRRYRHMSVLTALVHDETEGEIRAEDGRPRAHYTMNAPDRAALARGVVACARILFAAGAREVLIPATTRVLLRSVAELDALDTSFIAPHEVPLSSVHPMGTLRMGEDPKTSVVSSKGEHHRTRGLYVADGSIFPTSLGGPPQISIYAFALKIAEGIICVNGRANKK